METHINCPKCGVSVDGTPAEPFPSHCPMCGIRVACPKCRSGLEIVGENTDSLFCSTCGEIVIGADTVPVRTVANLEHAESRAGGVRPQLRLAGFEVVSELGQGGMGIVYRARQLSLNRDVAVKVLKPNLGSTPHLLARFRIEAEAAGRLTDSHILPVFDVLDLGDAPVLVMPFVEGSDLRRIIKDRCALRDGRSVSDPHPWANLSDREFLPRMLSLIDQLIDAVAAMHAAEVLHRDIKPSNVLVDQRGNAWLSDFGLARLGENGSFTGKGSPLGTHGYMSPEQASGMLDVDTRSDLFSLGVTMYQCLTQEMPFGSTGAKTTSPLPIAPSRRQRLLSRDLDAVILKALELRPQDRYGSAVEFQEDWQLARQGLLPKARRLGPMARLTRHARRNPWGIAAALAVAVFGSLAIYQASVPPPVPVHDPNRTVRVATDPPGARVVLVPIDEDPYDETDGLPLVSQAITSKAGEKTPRTVTGVAPGTYLVVADLPGHGFHEVYRTVPARGANPMGQFAHLIWTESPDGTVELPPIRIPQDRPDKPIENKMYRFKESKFTMGSASPSQVAQIAPPFEQTVYAFFLDTHEVSVSEYRKVMKTLPGQYRSFTTHVPDDLAVSFIGFDEAVAFAEMVGKRLPTEAEFEFAATLGGTRDFPWGNDPDRLADWNVGPVGKPDWDRTETEPPVFGLYSNVAEWTTSMLGPYPSKPNVPPMPDKLKALWRTGRVVRGGPWPVVIGVPAPAEWTLGTRWRHAVSRTDHYAGLGFRCARSDWARFIASE